MNAAPVTYSCSETEKQDEVEDTFNKM